MIAAVISGGFAPAVWVSAIGTTEWRELRGRIPWYGSLFNHAQIVLATAAAALVYSVLAPEGFKAAPLNLGAGILSGVAFVAVNSTLGATAVAMRERASVSSIFASDHAIAASGLLALSPLAWLMANAYVNIGWWAALLFVIPLYSQRSAFQKVVEIRDMFTQTVRALAQAVDARDKFTAGHSERVQRMAVDTGRILRCSESDLEALEWGGLLHDIGKIGVPDFVLLKQDRLTKEERILMNQHPVKGAEIIGPVEKLTPELPIIRHHHEWYNGSGYPDRLAGEEIPWLARILSVADAFEAMTAARPYRMRPLTPTQGLLELRRFSGIQFDPACVEAFAKTDWVAGLPDPARPDDVPVPLLAQAAAMRAAAASTEPPAPPAS